MSTYACLASGPSLNHDDIEYCRDRGWSLATCNNSILLAPDTKVHHSFDLRWWQKYYELARATGAELSTCNPIAARDYKIKKYHHRKGGGFGDDKFIYQGGPLSGYQLIQIVGNRPDCDRIILLGYDMKHDEQGNRHFHEDHENGWPNAELTVLKARLHFFDDLARHSPIEIINASRDTAITSFRIESLNMIK